MEVERKFLVPDPPDLAGTEAAEIEQGYLAIGSGGEVRLRRKGDSPRAFEPLDWLGGEVTGDERYLNETLAIAGAP